MLNRLRVHFKGFFKQYRCLLWTANVILTISPISLLFRDILNGFYFFKGWYEFWFDHGFKRMVIYNLMMITLLNYVPMIMQISSLIFGFVRINQDKIKASNERRELSQHLLVSTNEEVKALSDENEGK